VFDDWSIFGTVIALGIIVMFAHSSNKPQYVFNKKFKYIHVRSVKKF